MSTKWITEYVDKADFTGLFVEELGWERPARGGRTKKVDVDGEPLVLSEAASFRGVAIWVCPSIPSGQAQRVVDKVLRKESAERVVIFHDENRQVWRWPQARDAAGAGTPRLVAHEHFVGRANEALRQRLQFVQIGMDEDDISVLEVVRRLRRAFDSDKVTKSFYSKFAEQHRELTGAIKGIAVSDKATKPELRWYGSILLNRLMFIYFMQRKGFLDGDVDYLRNRLDQIRKLKRPGSFYEFYKDFLIPLFHEGLGADTKNRVISDPAIEALIGDIPYINGGIFSKHPLEEANDIRVPDKAFEKIFDFFDQWQWHLDERSSGNPNEINPDVLGYIFEQFVNNRDEVSKGNKAAATNADKGAYYTKEDVTGYMTANTLVPVFLESLLGRVRVNLWRLVALDPDRYIWSSVKHGCELPLPEAISQEASNWPRPTWDSLEVPSELGLPAESWWEVVDRRKHVQSLMDAARAGDINSVDLCVTNNLDLETLAVDLLDALDTPEDVTSAWEVLTELRVIDPTCGSGAFLFAALNILHRLYSAAFEAAALHAKTTKNKELAAIVKSANEHPNRDYFLLKHAALNNLYGVDLMHEAVEIARLRLFLKLIAQIESRTDIEPLPDLEFNIKSGNVLVGALTTDDILARIDLLNQDKAYAIEKAAGEVATAYADFARAQEGGDHLEMVRSKLRLTEISSDAREQLDEWWFESERRDKSIDAYRARVNPFHWMIEFPGVLARGGFDVVVGNPPYVAPGKLDYQYEGFETDRCPDIYAPCLERSGEITSPDGRLSMIVPISSQFGEDFKSLRTYLRGRFKQALTATFDRRPDSLFGAGVGVRNVIWTCAAGQDGVWASRTNRWSLEFRPMLFENLRYVRSNPTLTKDGWIRLPSAAWAEVLTRMLGPGSGSIGNSVSRRGEWQLSFKGNALYFLSVFVDPPPVIEPDGSPGVPTMMSTIYFNDEEERDAALAVLLSKFAFVWWGLTSDNLNVTISGISSTPINPSSMSARSRKELSKLGRQLIQQLPKHMTTSVYRQRTVSRYVIPDLRATTDKVDKLLAEEFGYTEQLADLELAYASLFKGEDEDGG